MRLFKGFMNNGQYGGWENEYLVAESKEDAIRILQERYPYRIGIYDFGASEFEVDGYTFTVVKKD